MPGAFFNPGFDGTGEDKASCGPHRLRESLPLHWPRPCLGLPSLARGCSSARSASVPRRRGQRIRSRLVHQGPLPNKLRTCASTAPSSARAPASLAAGKPEHAAPSSSGQDAAFTAGHEFDLVGVTNDFNGFAVSESRADSA